ncbi:hypothetical protein CZ765_04140 [Corynebacterium casei]|nr:hypothetical protein CZ765_04140 [Corynebacterium casei]
MDCVSIGDGSCIGVSLAPAMGAESVNAKMVAPTNAAKRLKSMWLSLELV